MSSELRDPLSQALEALIGRFSALIRAVGFRHGLTQDEVDALFQDVRIRLWGARRDPAALAELPSSYVYQTAVSVVLDRMRHRRSADQRLAPLDPSLAGSDTSAERVAHDELVAQVDLALGTLMPARRTVVRLHLVGYQRDEICAMLGWSEGKTRNLLYRGLDDLRSALTRAGIHAEARE